MTSNWGDEVSALVALVSLMGGATSWWLAHRSGAAREEAERARDEAEATLAAMQILAAAAQRAFPEKPAIEFRIEKLRDEHRLRNVGTEDATNVRFTQASEAESLLPKWLGGFEAVDINSGDFADFEAWTLARGSIGLAVRATPRWIWVTCDQVPAPVKLEMPPPK